MSRRGGREAEGGATSGRHPARDRRQVVTRCHKAMTVRCAELVAEHEAPHRAGRKEDEMTSTTVQMARSERTDHLGRVIPGLTVAEACRRVRGADGERQVTETLAQCESREAYNTVLKAALDAGWTHGPMDLAGRRSALAARKVA